eukprot:gnl/Chilomastix_cuspidata/6303.p1 GENE.gnl/Chilomastix_cuspidata/6303~~gnl/Chilomastix_cuspidata/6303.p1  ORF type:complete len:175 (-),score=27.62 gnl/Chilomastix_cuspidata/6303:738-1262(-)
MVQLLIIQSRGEYPFHLGHGARAAERIERMHIGRGASWRVEHGEHETPPVLVYGRGFEQRDGGEGIRVRPRSPCTVRGGAGCSQMRRFGFRVCLVRWSRAENVLKRAPRLASLRLCGIQGRACKGSRESKVLVHHRPRLGGLCQLHAEELRRLARVCARLSRGLERGGSGARGG